MVSHSRTAVLLLNHAIDSLNRYRHHTWPSNIDCTEARAIIAVVEEIVHVMTILREQMALEDKS
jgi:hypothetical protein